MMWSEVWICRHTDRVLLLLLPLLLQVKDIMIENIEKVLDRGEKLDLLVDKTELLQGEAFAFRREAKRARRVMWWKVSYRDSLVCRINRPQVLAHVLRGHIGWDSTAAAAAYVVAVALSRYGSYHCIWCVIFWQHVQCHAADGLAMCLPVAS